MATLQELLGGGLPPGLLSPAQQQAAEQRAQNALLTNLGFALLQSSRGQPGQKKPSIGQVIGQAGPVGLQAYQQSFDKTLADTLKGLQVQDIITKQKEAQQLRTLLPQVFQTTRAPSQTIYDVEGETTVPGAVTSVKIDPARLQALMMIPGGAEAVRGLAETQKLVRQAGLTTGAQEAPSPFAPYLTAQSPEVRKLAETYTNALKSGAIDEETAYKRIEPLAKMEDTFVARQAATLDRNEARRNAAAERELKREEGTTEKAKAAGFAQTMVQADTLIEDLVSKYDEKVFRLSVVEQNVQQCLANNNNSKTPLMHGFVQNFGLSLARQLAKTKCAKNMKHTSQCQGIRQKELTKRQNCGRRQHQI